MKHFANYIDIYPLTSVQSIDGNTVITNDGSEPDRFVAFSSIVMNEVPSNKNGNSYYRQTASIPLSAKMNDAQRAVYTHRRPVVVMLYDDQAQPIVWGDITYRARVEVSPRLENDILEIERESIDPVL